MKTLFVALVALLFAFFLGCQSSITDPIVSEPTNSIGVPDPENDLSKDVLTFTYPNVIKLEGLIYDPSHWLNSYATISGVVRYRFEKNDFDDIFPSGAIKIALYVNAKLKVNCSHSHRPWSVNKRTVATIDVTSSMQTVKYFEKSFRVFDTCCSPLNLVLKFKLSGKSLTLDSMRLVKIRLNETVENSVF